MNEQQIHHKMVVGSFIKNKLQEYEYFLLKIIKICSLVNQNFLAGISPVNTSDEDINFTFNAFVNTFQSLKDSLETATSQKIAWSYFSDVRHSEFFKECRNAITHDGMQIINAYTDGKYYIANDIERIDNKGKCTCLDAPKQDVLTLCLEFSVDLMSKVEKIADDFGQSIPTQSNVDKITYIERYMNNAFVPEFARTLFQQNRNIIEQQLAAHVFDPVADIKKQTVSVRNLCQST
ncbi:hypothetical protein [Methylobacter marinus]|uniref:hypothetical protein n=1 Tax=Methylobacter marinus TaxID=34058 RepID=UPI00036C7A79|nr:hypothetical protein [Methylobacter marinus]